MWAKSAQLRSGKATGRDLIPAELFPRGGPNCMAVLGCVAAAAAHEGAPLCRKGGRMAAAPKKPTIPMDLVNSCGILCSSVAAKLYGKVVRDACVPTLDMWAHGRALAG